MHWRKKVTQRRNSVVGGIVLVALFVIFVPLFFKETSVPLKFFTMPNLPPTPSPNYFSLAFSNTEQVLRHPFEMPLLPAKAWVLQLVDLPKDQTAKALVETLRQKGFKAYMVSQDALAGKPVTRVFVGPELSTDNINKLKMQLQKDMSLQSTITVFDPLLL